MIYLYLKTHNKTGLKYLGKTVQDPYSYKGSGVVWKDHIKKHGYDVNTEVLYETDSLEKFIKKSIDYSNKWNIVESKEFANLVLEDGGQWANGVPEDVKNKISKTLTGKMKGKIIHKGKRNPFFGKKHTEEHKQYLSRLVQGNNNPGKIERQCPHCGKVGKGGAMKRWHLDNCKEHST